VIGRTDGIERETADGSSTAELKDRHRHLDTGDGFDRGRPTSPPSMDRRRAQPRESGGATPDAAYQECDDCRTSQTTQPRQSFAFLGLNCFNTIGPDAHMDRLFGELSGRGATTVEVTEDANTKYRTDDRIAWRSLWTAAIVRPFASYYFNPRRAGRC